MRSLTLSFEEFKAASSALLDPDPIGDGVRFSMGAGIPVAQIELVRRLGGLEAAHRACPPLLPLSREATEEPEPFSDLPAPLAQRRAVVALKVRGKLEPSDLRRVGKAADPLRLLAVRGPAIAALRKAVEADLARLEAFAAECQAKAEAEAAELRAIEAAVAAEIKALDQKAAAEAGNRPFRHRPALSREELARLQQEAETERSRRAKLRERWAEIVRRGRPTRSEERRLLALPEREIEFRLAEAERLEQERKEAAGRRFPAPIRRRGGKKGGRK